MKNLLLASAVAGAMLCSGSAYASVKFLRVVADAEAGSSAWNGIGKPKSDTGHDKEKTKKLSEAELGLAAAADASSSSGTDKKQATASASESTLVQLTDPSAGEIDFSGTSAASVGSKAPDGQAFAGDNSSFAGYRFRLTSRENLDISYDTSGSNEETEAYEVKLVNVKTDDVVADYFVPSSLGGSTGSSVFVLPKGKYQLFIYEGGGPFAPDFATLDGPGSASGQAAGDFAFTLAVPELPTWAMMFSGFAALGLLSIGARRRAPMRTA